MNRTGRRAVVVAFGLTAFSATGSATALHIYQGDDYAYTPSSNGSYARACDRERDGHSVYTLYYRTYDSFVRRVEVFSGNGYCQNSDTNESNPVFQIKACENIPSLPDACSSWVYR